MPPLLIHRTIVPPDRFPGFGLSEVWESRELLWAFAARDIKVRYRQTVLGVLWVILQPVSAAIIFAFLFGRLAGFQSDGVDYFCWVFAGQLAWSLFAGVLGRASNSLMINTHLVAKIFFPRMVLPLSTTVPALMDVFIGLVVLLIVMAFKGAFGTWQLLTLPIWLFFLIALGLGLGMIAGALAVPYRDVGLMTPVALQLWFFASPVGWPVSELTQRFGETGARWYLWVNPVAPLLQAVRWSLFGRGTVPWGFVVWGAVVSLVTFTVGTIVFRTQERRFADVI